MSRLEAPTVGFKDRPNRDKLAFAIDDVVPVDLGVDVHECVDHLPRTSPLFNVAERDEAAVALANMGDLAALLDRTCASFVSPRTYLDRTTCRAALIGSALGESVDRVGQRAVPSVLALGGTSPRNCSR